MDKKLVSLTPSMKNVSVSESMDASLAPFSDASDAGVLGVNRQTGVWSGFQIFPSSELLYHTTLQRFECSTNRKE